MFSFGRSLHKYFCIQYVTVIIVRVVFGACSNGFSCVVAQTLIFPAVCAIILLVQMSVYVVNINRGSCRKKFHSMFAVSVTNLCSGGRGCALTTKRWKEAAVVWVWV